MKWKQFIIGVSILVVGHVSYFLLLGLADDLPTFIAYMPYVIVLVASGVIGYLVNTHLIRHLVMFGVVATVIVGIANYVWSSLGMPADFTGIKGAATVAVLSLPFILVLSLVGGTLGGLRNNDKNT